MFVTNISFLAESYATPSGKLPTGMFLTTELVVSEIAETELEAAFVTNISPLAESYATPIGVLPTVMVLTEIALAVCAKSKQMIMIANTGSRTIVLIPKTAISYKNGLYKNDL